MTLPPCSGLAVLVAALPAAARSAVSTAFRVLDIRTAGAVIHLRVGGQGPAILMLHGFGDSGDMWQPLAIIMVKTHTVIIPDLRGMGLSSHPDSGYDKKTQAQDMAQVLDALKVASVALVTHDIGNMVGYAFAAQYPARVTRWVAMDAPLPGVGNWAAQLSNPKTWHFNFHGPDEERLVAGRERIFLDRFYNELSANPAAIDEQTREHYAQLYAQPHAMHDALEQFAAFPQDGIDNRAFLAKGKLAMPVLAIGGDHSYGAGLADELGAVASNVRGAVIVNAGHWLIEEQPAEQSPRSAPFSRRRSIPTRRRARQAALHGPTLKQSAPPRHEARASSAHPVLELPYRILLGHQDPAGVGYGCRAR
jgi:pimeloyl-ACP methyl ester carboxylesterase